MKKVCDYSLLLKDTNAVKGIAIMAMLVHHLFFQNPEYGTLVHQLGLIGKVCVAMFLFLSGFGLTIQYGKMLNDNDLSGGATLMFIIRRFVKFYMGYWVIFLIFVPVGVFVFGRGLEVPYGADANIPFKLVTDFLGLNSLKSYNITWWFNRLILVLYFIFPLIYWYSRNKWAGLAILAVSYLNPNLFPFVLGMWVATNIEKIDALLKRYDGRVICALSIAMSVMLCIARQVSPIPYTQGVYIDGITAAFTALSVVTLRQVCGYEFCVLPFLGRHSMNMYMVHTFILGYFFKEFIYGFKYPVLMFLVLLVISLALSVIIEGLKRYVGIYRLQDYLISKINLIK